MKNNLLIILTLVLLTGCARFQERVHYYKVSPEIKVEFKGKTFLVRDDLERSAVSLQESFGVDVAKAFLEVLTLTLVDLTPPASSFEGAMQNYLDEYKVGDCSIVRSNIIPHIVSNSGVLGYEIFYKCE